MNVAEKVSELLFEIREITGVGTNILNLFQCTNLSTQRTNSKEKF